MKAFAVFIAILCFSNTVYADYVVKDGSGNTITIKSLPISPGQMPQSVPTDQNGNPFSVSNPLSVQPPSGNGASGGANPPSLSDMTLLGSFNAYALRSGMQVGVNCVAGMDVVLDDQSGSLTPTIIPLDGSSTEGGQGSSYWNSLHTGRVRFYSTNPTCQYWARQWP
jgi:hypothetical protein